MGFLHLTNVLLCAVAAAADAAAVAKTCFAFAFENLYNSVIY